MRALIAISLIVGLVSPVVASATDGLCTAENALAVYLTAHKASPMRIAAFSHGQKEWIGRYWNGKTLETLADSDFDNPPTNDPTLFVNRSGDAAIYVIDTNPLLYSTKQGEVTVSDIEGIDRLKQLLSLAGGFASSLTDDAGQRGTKISSAVAPAFQVQPQTQIGIQAIVPPPASFAEEISPLLSVIADTLDKQTRAIQPANAAIISAQKNLEGPLERVAQSRDTISNQLQLAEQSDRELDPTVLRAVPVDAVNVTSAFVRLKDAANAAAAVQPRCPGTIDALRFVFVAELDGPPSGFEAKKGFYEQWLKDIDKLEHAAGDCLDVPGPQIELLARKLAKHPLAAAGARGDLQTVVGLAYDAVDEFLANVSKRAALLDQSKDVLAKRDKAVQDSVQVHDFAKLRDDYLANAGDLDASAVRCLLTTGVTEVRKIAYSDLGIGFTKIRNEKFNIAVRPAFSSNIERKHDDASAAYHLRKSGFDFDIDTGLTYTRLYEPEYKAVELPSGSATKFELKQTGRKTRAGKLALMVTARPKKLRGFGPQVGFGFDTGTPAVFTGVGWSIGSYAKLSAGETWQRITRLGDGMFIGKGLDSADALVTRDGWTSRPYFAFTLTLNDLPIFVNSK